MNYPEYPINSEPGKCDRCGGNFPGVGQDSIMDFLLDEYPGKQICVDCDTDITLHHAAAILGISIQNYLKTCLKNYGVEVCE